MKKYSLLYADPPWKQSRGGAKAVRPNSSGIAIPYQTDSIGNIEQCLTKAVAITTNDSILFLWTIEKYLWEAEQITKRLGYKLHSRMIWNKVTGIPAAFTIRFGHEYLLYCYRGEMIPVSTLERGKIHSVFTEQVTNHSHKPQIAYEIIERLYPDLLKLEMYARYKRTGWDCWGNEVDIDESNLDAFIQLGVPKGKGL